ncbi:MAG TPA: hypothetical protein VI160_07855 [Gemmatimonadales bacterium]
MATRARRNLFASLTLMSFLLAGAFTMHDGVHWIWADRPLVAALLVILGLLFAARWARAWKELASPPAGGAGSLR